MQNAIKVQSQIITKLFIEPFYLQHLSCSVWGRDMTEFVWHWTKGNKKIYTRRSDLAEQAMKEGFLVMGMKRKPYIYRN